MISYCVIGVFLQRVLTQIDTNGTIIHFFRHVGWVSGWLKEEKGGSNAVSSVGEQDKLILLAASIFLKIDGVSGCAQATRVNEP